MATNLILKGNAMPLLEGRMAYGVARNPGLRFLAHSVGLASVLPNTTLVIYADKSRALLSYR